MSTREMNHGRSLRERLIQNEFVTAIGAHDALSALLVERAGFDAVYVGSYATEAVFHGKPDLALMSRTERLMIATRIVRAVSIPVVVDMEEGYGNAISVRDAMRDFAGAGIAAVHIDDEELPSKCPFLEGIPKTALISVEEMCGKLRAAVDGRGDSSTAIIARSDVIGTMSLDQYRQSGAIEEVVSRSNRYLAAGADAVFTMALDEEELRYFRANIDGPLVGVFATIEPIPIRAFESAGYAMTIGSLVSLYMAARGIMDGLAALKNTGDWNQVQDYMISDAEFFDIVQLEKYAELYRKYDIR